MEGHVQTDIVQRKKESQGNYECEVLCSGSGQNEEAESTYSWRHCSKNPGHQQFIPVSEFSQTDLPEWCRIPKMEDYVKYMSTMTVRLKVGYTSRSRPDGYPFCDTRGAVLPHYGSGFIWKIELNGGPCTCAVCKHSLSPCQTSYNILVRTARHVVYDNEEARATQVNLFYDDEASSTDGRMQTIRGTEVDGIHDEGDNCTLLCITHDGLLVRLLEYVQAKHDDDDEFKFYGKIIAWPNEHHKNLCLIISHPHGQPKKVTVGEMNSCTQAGPLSERVFTYSTDTCPGCSGAFVVLLEFYGVGSGTFVHSGMNLGAVHSKREPTEDCNKSGSTLALKNGSPGFQCVFTDVSPQ